MMHRKWFVSAVGAMAIAAAVAGVSARQLGSRPVDDWTARLERADRVAGLKIDYIIASLGLTPGVVVADIGAGPGVLTLPITKAVAPAKVYAVEIEQGFLDRINGKAREAGVTLVPLKLYEKKGRVKLELGVARGKRQYDKRVALAEREARRDIERAVRERERRDSE